MLYKFFGKHRNFFYVSDGLKGLLQSRKRELTNNLGGYTNVIKRFRILRLVGTTSVILLGLLALYSVVPLTVQDNSVEGIAKESNTFISVAIGSNSAELNMLPTNISGSFATSTDAESAKFNVNTNNSSGYTLSIAGNDDNGLLTNTDPDITSNNILTSISSALSTESFKNITLNDVWGYKPSRYNSSVNTDTYYPAPTTEPSTLDRTFSATSRAYDIALGARVDYARPAGTYTNTFVLTAVGNPVNYTINYLDMTSDPTVANLPDSQSSATAGTAANLIPNRTPTRIGYTFKSWCYGTVNVGDYQSGTRCVGTEYNPGSLVSFIDQTSISNILDLYAVWTPDTYTVTLNKNGGSGGSNSTTATYDEGILGEITNPIHADASRTVSGFSTAYNNASGATVSSTATLTSTAPVSLAGWYQESAATHNIASNSPLPVLASNTAYTNSDGRWNYTSGVTLYAGWNTGSYAAVKLPTISKLGYTCGWSDSNNTTNIKWLSGYDNFVPGADTVLYGVCVINKYSVTIKTDTGISSVNLNGTNCTSTSGCTVSDLTYGQSYNLTATPAANYNFSHWTLNGSGNISDTTADSTVYTVGATADIPAGGNVATIRGSGMLYMQDLSSDHCGDYGYKIAWDKRDEGDSYNIERLDDGNCWMLENLRLNLTSISLAELKGNTNATDTALTYLKNGGGTIPSATQGVRVNNDWNGAYLTPQIPILNNSKSSDTTNHSGTAPGLVGIHYNYCAASAGTACAPSQYTPIANDICPKGWRIPSTTDYENLANSYSGRLEQLLEEFNAVYSGYSWDDDDRLAPFYKLGAEGYYWASDGFGDGYYSLKVSSSNLFDPVSTALNVDYGASVRCILKNN